MHVHATVIASKVYGAFFVALHSTSRVGTHQSEWGMWFRKFRYVSIGQGIQNLGTVATPALLFLLLSIPAVPRREFREGQGQHPQIMWFFKIFQWWILLEYVSIFFLCWWFGAFFIFPYIYIYILGISSSQLTFIFFRGVGIPPTRYSPGIGWCALPETGETHLGNIAVFPRLRRWP